MEADFFLFSPSFFCFYYFSDGLSKQRRESGFVLWMFGDVQGIPAECNLPLLTIVAISYRKVVNGVIPTMQEE